MIVKNRIGSSEDAPKTMCITQAKLFLYFITNQMWGTSVDFERQRMTPHEGKYYDIYTCTNPHTGERKDFYFDITAFYGKGGVLLNSGFLDLPTHNHPFPISEILGEKDTEHLLSVARLIDSKTGSNEITNYIESLTITFKQYASNIISQYIALPDWENRSILVTPLRSFEGNMPILHSFKFYSLFIMHQIDHILFCYNREQTETPPRADYYDPVIGNDCISFEPLPDFSFVNDFLNYTFWTHKPDAFFNDYEKHAIMSSAFYGIAKGLFTQNELINGIETAVLQDDVRSVLVSSVAGYK